MAIATGTDRGQVMKSWKAFFWFAALYNLAASLPLIVDPGGALAAAGAAVPEDLSYYRLCGVLILCFGGIYAIVAGNPERFAPVLWFGIVGKVGVGIIFGPAILAGELPASSVAIMIGDQLFALAFLVFLLRVGRARAH